MSLPSSRPSSISPEPIGYVPPPRQLPLQGARQAGPDVHFTVFIRVPFPRRAFIDPQPVDWDASKDRALWKILSRTSKSGNIDWRALAEQFDVTLPFLLQQAAWLYERQLSQVRAQMRKVNTKHSVAPSPVPGSVSGSATAGGHATRRAGSGAAGSRVPSSLSMRTKDSPVPSNEGGVAGSSLKSKAPRLSRTSSTHATPSNRRDLVSSLRHPINQQGHEKNAPHGDARKEPQPGTIPTQSGVQHGEQVATSPSAKADSSSSSSSSDSEPAEQISKSQTFKRRPRFSSTTAPAPRFEDGEGDDGDDEDPPAFLPFSNPAPPDAHDPSATLRIHTPSRSAQCQAAPSQPTTRQWSQTTHSSASSGSSAAAAGTQVDGAQSQRPSGPLSPRRAAELAALSPRRRTLAKEGSDGTPSMGSSFSDLDDASVTQSALEEALLSNMQHGGVASRMSTISQALKSRYL